MTDRTDPPWIEEAVEAAARAMLARCSFDFCTDPSEEDAYDLTLDALEEARVALRAAVPAIERWHPIETAPKDACGSVPQRIIRALEGAGLAIIDTHTHAAVTHERMTEIARALLSGHPPASQEPADG